MTEQKIKYFSSSGYIVFIILLTKINTDEFIKGLSL
jgi:hypothetical protein